MIREARRMASLPLDTDMIMAALRGEDLGDELDLDAAIVAAIRELSGRGLIVVESNAHDFAAGHKVIDITSCGYHTLDGPASQIYVQVSSGASVGAIQVGNYATATATQLIDTAHARDADMPLAPLAVENHADDANEEAADDPDDPSSYPLLPRSSTALFSERFAKAFPGVRGIARLEPPHAIERLAILLKKPLAYRTGDSGYVEPIWFWGRGDLQISKFSVLSESTVLLDILELIIDEVIAVHTGAYYQKFVYIKTRAAEPSGAYPSYDWIDAAVSDRGYADEECALFEGRYFTRAEYDDGAGVVGGYPVDFGYREELRVRFLTPFNCLIAAHNSPINNKHFDRIATKLLNAMLRGEATIEDLARCVDSLPKREPLGYEL